MHKLNKKRILSTFSVAALFTGMIPLGGISANAAVPALAKYYSTNASGLGVEKTIEVDGDISDWNSSMIIAQGAANDDPRVYRTDSMYEVPLDLYTLYGAYDNDNLYLMWEMTNVQDVVSPDEEYPLTEGSLYKNMNLPFFIAVNTGKSDVIGNEGRAVTGATLWDSGITFSGKFNRLIAISSNGKFTSSIFTGDSQGLNPMAMYESNSGIQLKYGAGILSSNVYGINGSGSVRAAGDMSNDNSSWVDFNTKGHNSSKMDYHYEMSVPLKNLGVTKDDIKSTGLGVMLISTAGKSGMDSLPYDLSMNDNAGTADGGSQTGSSLERSDEDYITSGFARIGTSEQVVSDLQNTSTISSKSINLGSTVTVTCASTGGTGTKQYAVFYKQKTQTAWTKAMDYSTIASAKITPKAATSYTVRVKAKDGSGNIVNKDFTVKVNKVTPLENTSKVSATTINLGSTVKVTCASTGGTGTKQYAVFYKQKTQTKWTKVKGYSTATTAKVTPKAATRYTVRVKAKDGAGNVVNKDFTIKVNKVTPLENTSKVSATTINLGSTVTVTCASTGGTGTKQYAVFYKQKTQTSWTKVKGYSTATTAKVTPKAATSYTVRVKAKDGAGNVVNKDFTVKVNKVTPLENTSKVSATAINLGSTVTVTCASTGGTGTKQYAVFYKQKTQTKWTKVKGYSTATTAKVTPKAATSYTVRVKAKDAAGNVVNKDFTVKVS